MPLLLAPELDQPGTAHGWEPGYATPRPKTMTGKRLCLLALVVATVLLAPATCSQSSVEDRPRCDTVLGYWTPISEWMQGLVLIVLVLCVIAFSRRRRTRR